MNRRTLLKQLAVSSTAAILLPSCLLDKKKVSLALNHLEITPEEEELLAVMADVIVPETDTPGARSLKAHHFTLVMVDDCMEKKEQQKFLAGMRSFESSLRSLTGKSFRDASVEEQTDALNQLEASRDKVSDEMNAFYWKTKGYILQGYLSSQHFLTNVKKYELVPGPDFRGCVPVADNKQNIS